MLKTLGDSRPTERRVIDDLHQAPTVFKPLANSAIRADLAQSAAYMLGSAGQALLTIMGILLTFLS
jgi:hypothetical protein